MLTRRQGQEQRASQQWKGGRTAAVLRRPSATDPGIRDGPFPQARKATPAAHQGANLMEEAERRPEAILLAGVRASPSATVTGGERSRSESRRCHRSEDRRCEWSGSGESDAGSAQSGARARGAGIFARVACSGVVDPELAKYAVQVLGMGKERKEFVVHLCAPQEPGRCEETGAALQCGEWTVVPGGAGRGVDGESAETSAKTGRGLRPEIAEAGPAFFGPMDGERLGAQVSALTDELGQDPLARPMEPRSFNAPRSPQLGSRDGDATPRGEVRGPNGRKKGRMSRDMFPSPAYWTPPAVSTPPVSSQDPAVLQEKLKEARARLGRKRRGRKWLLPVLAERVLDSTADTVVTAELDSRRRKCHTGSPEDMGKRDAKARRKEDRPQAGKQWSPAAATRALGEKTSPR